MTVVPASVAGVERIVMITPPGPDGRVSPDRLAAAHVAGAGEVYRVFGAQGVAALAYGTESIPAVDFIAGPGNAYVTAAKKEVFGQVGIDMLAGPSEVAIIADSTARADWVGAEMLAQAEHTGGSATLLADHEPLVTGVLQRLEEDVRDLPKGSAVRRNLEGLGALILASSPEQCAGIANRLAPEHLVIMMDRPDAVSGMVRHAGAIFLGHHSPVATGDYIAGPSHCLPTGTTARFFGGLTANTFLKGTSLIRYGPEGLRHDASELCRLAEAEGLDAHVRSVRRRLDQ
jgi:histidinol dehydrogenase